MLRLICVVSVFCVVDVFARQQTVEECLQGVSRGSRQDGKSVFAVNFTTTTAVPDAHIIGISKDIKFVSQKFHADTDIMCSALNNLTKIFGCYEFRFEVFGVKYMVLAGDYRLSVNSPSHTFMDFHRAQCMRGWDFTPTAAEFCNRDEFTFRPVQCNTQRGTFFILAKIDEKHCVDQLSETIRSKGLVGSVFLHPSYTAASSRNDKDIRSIGAESWTQEQQNISSTYCQFLEHQKHGDGFIECYLLKLEVYGKPYLVLYGTTKHSYKFSPQRIENSPDHIQCHAGLEFNPLKLFPCDKDPKNGIVIATLEKMHECWRNHPLIGIGAPQK